MSNVHSKHPSSPLSVRITAEALEKLESLAKATGRTKSFLASEAIERYLENEAWQVKSIKQTIEKIDHNQMNFVEHDKVVDWLNSWGTAHCCTIDFCLPYSETLGPNKL